MSAEITFLFYGALNDFLRAGRQHISFIYRIEGTPAVKDVIEAIGVPHTEIDVIEANGLSVDFSYLPTSGDIIHVYPVREAKQKLNAQHLIEKTNDVPAFVLGVHLGTLVSKLRMLGFDVLYTNSYSDQEITDLAVAENRIVLTRDVSLLKRKVLKRGYWLRSQDVYQQLEEVINHLELHKHFKPFYRCLTCNGLITRIEKGEIQDKLEPNTIKYFDEYFVCSTCRKIYWKGSHYERMLQFIQQYSL